MKNDVDESPTGTMPSWCGPTRAKDMLGLTGEIIRGLLDSRCYDDLMELYGVRPDEASASLHYADLASLPAWDADLIIEIAGVAAPEELAALKQRELNAKRDIDREMWADQIAIKTAADTRISRRLRLAMMAESLPDAITPAEGVLFLRRAGIDVHYELLNAVATHTIGADTDEAVNTYRRLMDLPEQADSQPISPLNAAQQDMATATSPGDQPTPAIESVMPAAVPAKPLVHKIRNRETAILSAEINQAKANARNPDSATCVWDELTKLAESGSGPMIGFSSDGIQYRGKKYQSTQEPDVFTFKHLRDRMKRAETRSDARSRA